MARDGSVSSFGLVTAGREGLSRFDAAGVDQYRHHIGHAALYGEFGRRMIGPSRRLPWRHLRGQPGPIHCITGVKVHLR